MAISRPEDIVYGYLRTQGVVYQLEELETSIGRGEECSLQLDGKGISRLHARLSFNGRRPQLLDLGSSNGTFVNGLRLKPSIPHELRHGDVVRFAQARCTYSFELPPEAQRSPKVPKQPAEPQCAEEAPRRSALKSAKEEEESKEKPGAEVSHVAACGAGAAGAVPCVNVLPVPFPVMQPQPIQPMQPMQMYPPTHFPHPPAAYPQSLLEAQPPDPVARPFYSQRWSATDESQLLHKQDLLLQRLWKLEEKISHLADANLEVCQRASQDQHADARESDKCHDSGEQVDQPEQAGEAHLVAAALTAASERLASIAERQDTGSPTASRFKDGSPQAVGVKRRDEKLENVPALSSASNLPREAPEARDGLIAEMQRTLSLYEMVAGSNPVSTDIGHAPDDSSSSSGSVQKRPRPMFEGAVPETSVVLTAILSVLDELAGMGYANPNVGGHRKWNALANERARLAKEEALELERLMGLEEEEASLRQSTEAELRELSRLLESDAIELGQHGDHPMFQDLPQTKITAEQAHGFLQTELSRMEADKARRSAQNWLLTGLSSPKLPSTLLQEDLSF